MLVLPNVPAGESLADAHLDASPLAEELEELPVGLTLRGLQLVRCKKLRRLPDDLNVRHLDLTGCTSLEQLPEGLRFYELILKQTQLRELPTGLRVDFRLDLDWCTELRALPTGLKVGTLSLRGCTSLTALPEGLDVRFLDLQGCDGLIDWPASSVVKIGRLNLRGCSRLAELPETLGRLTNLDVAACSSLSSLPANLEVASWIDVASSGLRSLPESMADVPIRWNGVPVDERIAFRPETMTAGEILAESNAERRRVMLERFGLERFMLAVDAHVVDTDTDPGGERRLLRVRMEGDEDLVCVMVHCPSTQRRYLLRVPPTMTTCHQAVAWMAGFDDPAQYRPLVET